MQLQTHWAGAYRAALFIDAQAPISVEAHRVWEHTLLIPLSSIDPNVIFTARRIGIAIGDIPARIYDVDGPSVARAPRCTSATMTKLRGGKVGSHL
jgi:hypothetical protein